MEIHILGCIKLIHTQTYMQSPFLESSLPFLHLSFRTTENPLNPGTLIVYLMLNRKSGTLRAFMGIFSITNGSHIPNMCVYFDHSLSAVFQVSEEKS